MGTKNYNNYSDMITFSRASSGTALAKISYGPELVTNGTFDTDFSGWTVIGQQPSVVNSQLRLTTSSVNVGVSQNVGLQAGKMYLASYDIISITGGSMRLALGSAANGTNRTAPGSYSEFLYVSGDAVARLYQVTSFSAEVIVVDNISIKEVLYDQPDGTLQLFNHPTNQPRVEYDYQGNRLGLLVEEARTNEFSYSQQFNTGWSISNCAEEQNATIAPDGTLSASKATPNGNFGDHGFYKIFTSGVDRVASIFAKQASGAYKLAIAPSGSNSGPIFNLQTGEIDSNVTPATATITPVGNGWYRCTVTVDSTSTYAKFYIVNSNNAWSYSGDGTSGIYMWGAQLEAGSFPTSYIPTAGSTVTRAADVASIGVGAFGYNQTKNTIIVEASLFDSSWNPVVSRMISTTRYNEIRRDASGLADFTGLGITAVDSWPNDVIVKVGAASKPNDSSLVINGGTLRTSASGTLQYGIDTLKFGQNGTTEFTCMHLKSIAYYPRRLSDAQIKALTSPPETPTLSLTFDDSSTSYLETSIHG
jgi:hypothetical protein